MRFACAQEPSKPPPPDRDAQVIEAVLVDLLTTPKVHLEEPNEKEKKIYFRLDSPHVQPVGLGLLQRYDKREWEKLSAAQTRAAEAAAKDLLRRAGEKKLVQPFKPRDERIIVYTQEHEERDNANSRPFREPQVFRVAPPGYARDGQLALLSLRFSWSGGFHGGAARYLLVRKGDMWDVLLRDVVLFP